MYSSNYFPLIDASPRMYLHLLSVSAHCGSVQLELHNSHLESTKEHGEERMEQLKHCLAKVSTYILLQARGTYEVF